MKEKVLVSACLLGVNCKYNGNNNYRDDILKLLEDKEIIPVCPEIMGGLATPRDASEIKNGKVFTCKGFDVTDNFYKGARETLHLAKLFGIKRAYLKAKSPSCGCGYVYDGTFTNNLIEGDGITVRILKENGIDVISVK